LSLVKGGCIGDALAALFRGKGIDEEMRWADQSLVHRGGGLESQQLISQSGVHTASKLGQGFGQDKVLLRAIELHFVEATRIHDRHIGAQPLADGFIRSAHFMFEQLQCQQDACRNRVAPTIGAFGEAASKAVFNGFDQLGPGKGIAPLADGIGFGNDIGNVEPGAATAQPMLKVTS